MKVQEKGLPNTTVLQPCKPTTCIQMSYKCTRSL